MNVKVENTENKNEVKLTFNIEAEKFEEAMKKVYAKTAKYFNIPGFRKGKAPMQLVERQYGSAIFYEDAFNELVPEIYDEAIKENKVEAVSKPEIDIVQMEKGKELIFTATVATKPEVKLGKYKGIELKKIEYNVSDKDVEHELGHMAEHNARLVTVEDRPVEKGDITIIDFAGSIDGVAFDGGTAENQELEIGSNKFIPGFEDQVIGMKVNEEKDINVTFPEDYFSKDLAGKEVVFHVTLHEIKSRILPDIDEDFFKDLGYDKVTNAEELAKEVENTLKESKQKEIDDRFLEDVLKAASENMEVDLPEEIIDDEVHRMMNQFESQLKMQGLTMDQYYQFTNTTHETMHKEMEPEAIRRIKYRYLLEAVSEAEKIEVTDEEADKDATEMATNYGISKDELIEAFGGMEVLKYDSKMRKTLKFLQENN